MAASIAVVDYCKGNLASVQRGLADAGFDARITDARPTSWPPMASCCPAWAPSPTR
ncbi:MAG: hypothetical protein V8R08_01495 [Coriobacteriales bacterium]